jgi:puromycin-sensitive aminopeptidase
VVTDAASRLDGIERRFVPEADVAAFREVVSKAFARQLRKTGWDAKAGESDDEKLLRAAAVKALANVARDPAVVREASSRLAQAENGDGAVLDPNLLDAATLAAARAGDDAAFEAWTRKATTETDPAAKRRALVALASFEAPSLVAKAHALFATDVVPKQDATTFLGTLLASRSAKAATWVWVQANWSLVREKTAAPMLTRRLVESLGELFDQRSAVEAQFAAHATDLAASPAAVQQTNERMKLDEAVARRARPDLSRWLAARA